MYVSKHFCGICLGVELLGISTRSSLHDTAKSFSKVVVPLTYPPVGYENSSCSTSLPIFELSVLNSSYSGGCVALSHCGFNLHFRDD